MFLAKRENMGVNSSRTTMNLINRSTGEVRVSARPSSILFEEYARKIEPLSACAVVMAVVR